PAHRLAQQRLPFLAGQPAAVPVRAGILAPVVEEPDVVVLALQRADLPLDELVQLAEVGGQVRRDIEVHDLPPSLGGALRHTQPTAAPPAASTPAATLARCSLPTTMPGTASASS